MLCIQVYMHCMVWYMWIPFVSRHPWYTLANDARLEHAGLAGAFSDQRPSKRGSRADNDEGWGERTSNASHVIRFRGRLCTSKKCLVCARQTLFVCARFCFSFVTILPTSLYVRRLLSCGICSMTLLPLRNVKLRGGACTFLSLPTPCTPSHPCSQHQCELMSRQCAQMTRFQRAPVRWLPCNDGIHISKTYNEYCIVLWWSRTSVDLAPKFWNIHGWFISPMGFSWAKSVKPKFAGPVSNLFQARNSSPGPPKRTNWLWSVALLVGLYNCTWYILIVVYQLHHISVFYHFGVAISQQLWEWFGVKGNLGHCSNVGVPTHMTDGISQKKKWKHEEDTLQERWGYTPIVGMYPLLVYILPSFCFFHGHLVQWHMPWIHRDGRLLVGSHHPLLWSVRKLRSVSPCRSGPHGSPG